MFQILDGLNLLSFVTVTRPESYLGNLWRDKRPQKRGIWEMWSVRSRLALRYYNYSSPIPLVLHESPQ